MAIKGKSLPTYVHREFEAYLQRGRLWHGFLRVRGDKCHFERLVAFPAKSADCRGAWPGVAELLVGEPDAIAFDITFGHGPSRL